MAHQCGWGPTLPVATWVLTTARATWRTDQSVPCTCSKRELFSLRLAQSPEASFCVLAPFCHNPKPSGSPDLAGRWGLLRHCLQPSVGCAALPSLGQDTMERSGLSLARHLCSQPHERTSRSEVTCNSRPLRLTRGDREKEQIPCKAT